MANCCQKTSSTILFILSVLFFIITGVKFLSQHDAVERQCYITNTEYPESIHDSKNLISCNCGRYCKSDAGTCIRIFGHIVNDSSSNTMFLPSIETKSDNDGCTFAEKTCKNAEKIKDRTDAILRAQNRALEYSKLINTSHSIKCFEKNSDGKLYLENNDFTTYFIVASVLLGFFGLILICCICCNFCEDTDSSR